MQSLFAVLSGLVAVASAFTTPTTQLPGDGLSIYTPGLQQQVPAGTAFQITWNPSTKSTVSIVLLRGPSENVKPLYAIVERAPNTGSFSWTPSTDLEGDVTHYGLQIIDDATGQFQWSTQFGIKNDSPSHPSGHSGMPSGTPTPTPTPSGNGTAIATPSASSPPSNGSVSLTSMSTSKATSAPATTVSRSTASRSASASASSTPTGNAAAQMVGSAAFGLVGGVLALFAL